MVVCGCGGLARAAAAGGTPHRGPGGAAQLLATALTLPGRARSGRPPRARRCADAGAAAPASRARAASRRRCRRSGRPRSRGAESRSAAASMPARRAAPAPIPEPASSCTRSPSGAAVSRTTASVLSRQPSRTTIVRKAPGDTVWRASASRHPPISCSSSLAGTTTTLTTSVPLTMSMALLRQPSPHRARSPHRRREVSTPTTLPLAAVPDGEAAVVVTHRVGRFVAIAPRRVLQRAPADRRPEPGHVVPLRGLAGNGPAGDLALAESVAPMLDPEPAACGQVLGQTHVPGRQHAGRGACASPHPPEPRRPRARCRRHPPAHPGAPRRWP